jgi:PadR family transcriptional regulator, regulatory protein PadR
MIRSGGDVSSVRMTQVTALVLRTVAAGHRYGFDVMDRCALPSGTVYPALRRLDRAGLLESGWEDAEAARAEGRPRRRTYELTPAGRAALPGADRKLAEVARVLRRLPEPDPGEA